MIWLGIETSNSPLSIAIVEDGQIVEEIVQNEKLTHSVTVMPTIEELFQKANLKPTNLDAIAVSEGPGSYTGLRIGVTVAKTLAWTLKKPLVGVSSLQVVAANGQGFNGVICSLFDARRQNVYAAAYHGETLQPLIKDHHTSIEGLLEQLQVLNMPVLFVGLDAVNFKEVIAARLGDHAVFAATSLSLPRGSKLIELAQKQPLSQIDEVHSFVPQYHRITEAEANWIKDQKKGQ